MPRQALLVAVMLVALPLAASEPQPNDRQVPVVVRGKVEPGTVRAGDAIPLTVTITNGLPASIHHNTFRLEPTDWNGETVNISLVDIYREGPPNLFLHRPEVDPPQFISGMGSHEIKPGGTLTVKTDARKWKLRDGWLPGRYKVTIRVDHLTLDQYATLSVLSDPVEFRVE
jgi:hypothetical protein